MSRRWFALAVCAGCAARPAHPIPIALLIDGDRAAAGALPPGAVDGLELVPIALPPPAAVRPDDATPVVARARSAYARGEFDACRAELARLDVAHLLARGDRPTAAGVLVFDAACAWGAMDRAAAKLDAERLASFGLELGDIVVSPDVEKAIGDAIAAAQNAPRAKLAITGVVDARLSIDGKPAGCALPCTVELAPGDHVIAADADGYLPETRSVRSPDQSALAIAQQPAPAALAATQWRARVGRGLPPADATGATLLARLSGAPRIAFVHGDARITGALVVDGKLVASATGGRGGGPALVRELAYDGKLLQRPTLWQRPWFWIAVAGAAAGITGVVLYLNRPTDSSVGF
ncbi:MAG TPA: hypothetical protein VLX92_32400 [Kofleriaceae bacterium]|nr:hypothetical protein [Kofleriaceae bacterium]